MESQAEFVWSVDNTRCPVIEALTEIEAVSLSLVSYKMHLILSPFFTALALVVNYQQACWLLG